MYIAKPAMSSGRRGRRPEDIVEIAIAVNSGQSQKSPHTNYIFLNNLLIFVNTILVK